MSLREQILSTAKAAVEEVKPKITRAEQETISDAILARFMGRSEAFSAGDLVERIDGEFKEAVLRVVDQAADRCPPGADTLLLGVFPDDTLQLLFCHSILLKGVNE